ncbi:hypothetical protein [Geopsychrobacter electrodiphilus]|uniref:hypothetical protein n=1 Tax=Geopsychrobacter electrodiphilus TaxID=225196 RepID=UPI0012EB2296|nr:hypothetical protein [Geopsychrobacter electrodiphilus]
MTHRTDPGHDRRRTMVKQHMARRVEVIVMVILLIISLAHLLRLITGTELMVGKTVIPLWASVFGCVGPASLAGLFWWSRH